ncbi:DUF4270 domain-containing protein [Flavobacterium ponti]|uniref:DUF4270 domain-containing protein n=1 Tax=Flavobacterium ponti TaxID=665133 RepID=A0ABV9NZ40_9FLAO
MNTFTKALLLLFAFTFISCDKDFNTLGSDIVGDEHFNFEKYNAENLNSYIKPTGAVQTNNLPINSLGIYSNSVFGTTKAHFVSQIEMVNPDPSLGYNHYIDPVKDSVYVYIPFYSTLESTSNEGDRVYRIDSLYGDNEAKFNLKVYENGYYLRDFDPSTNNQTTQKYYSDFKPTIDNYKGAQVLNNGDVNENTEFFFDNKEILIYKTNGNGQYYDSEDQLTNDPDKYVIKERKLPGIWLNLNQSVFKSRILDAVALGKLYNNNTFKQYFKGLYFEVEENVTNQGSLVKLDFSKAELVVQYHYYFEDGVTNPELALKSSLKFQMGYSETGTKKSNSVNLLEFSNITSSYSEALLGNNNDGKLHLKGGVNGSVAYIDVFNDAELATLKAKKWLINEANLVFYIDQTTMLSADYEPQRVYLFDATNNKPLLDYYADISVGSSPKFNKYIHGGIIQKDSDGRGTKYKIRITDYINNVLNGTNPNNNGNARLGLVVTESIGIVTNAFLKTPFTIGSDEIKYVPVASVMNPLGTVLYGTQSTDPDKKLKLEIYYTEPN